MTITMPSSLRRFFSQSNFNFCPGDRDRDRLCHGTAEKVLILSEGKLNNRKIGETNAAVEFRCSRAGPTVVPISNSGPAHFNKPPTPDTPKSQEWESKCHEMMQSTLLQSSNCLCSQIWMSLPRNLLHFYNARSRFVEFIFQLQNK